MARQTLTADFWEVPITSGTLQNVGLVDIEINNAQNDDTGIVLEPSEIYQWDSATIYVRKANDNDAPCEVAYVPFKKTAGGGGGSYTLPVASASTLGGIKVGSGLSIDSDGVLTGASTYTLPTATASTLGGVKSSLDTGNVKVNADGTMTINGVQVMGYDEVAEMAMPSEIIETWTINSLNTTWGSSVDPHEIPANGWVMIRRNYNSGSNKEVLFSSTKNITSIDINLQKVYSFSTDLMFGYMPVRKGEHIVYRSQDSAGAVWEVTFTYSVGDAKTLGLI
jgi:hypothetical protein